MTRQRPPQSNNQPLRGRADHRDGLHFRRARMGESTVSPTPFGDHLGRLMTLLSRDDTRHLRHSFMNILCDKKVDDEEVLIRLKGAGLVRLDNHRISLRCGL